MENKQNKRVEKSKVQEVQDYLEERGIVASEVAIINAAIEIATRWGGNGVFVSEFKKVKNERRKEGKKLLFDDIPVHIRERVYSDIGEASMCWENPEKAGIFNSQQAAKIGLNLCHFVLDEIEEEKKR